MKEGYLLLTEKETKLDESACFMMDTASFFLQELITVHTLPDNIHSLSFSLSISATTIPC